MGTAIKREKEIKKWRREKKKNLVESKNPSWKDLSLELMIKISRRELLEMTF